MNSKMSERPVEIVMVEDDEGHARLIEKNIRRAGVNNEIVAFKDGTSALDFLLGPKGCGAPGAKCAFLILLDLNLPGMSGEEWIQWYQNQGKRTPVVVASGKGDILTITKGNDMTAALTKPFHMEELQELIEVLLADDWHEQVSVDKKLH